LIQINSEPDHSFSAMSSVYERAALSDYDDYLWSNGVLEKSHWLKQASHAESTCLPDECSVFSRQSTEWTSSGCDLQSHLDQAVLQDAVANCEVAVHVLDPNDPDFPIIAVSEGMSMLTEYCEQELVGKSCRFLSHECDNDPINIAHLRDARSKGASFETVIVNRKKSGQLYQVLLVLRRIALGNDDSMGQDHGLLLGLQVELPDGGYDDDDDDGNADDDALTFVAPELIAHTKDAAEKLASHLSQLLQKHEGSPFLDPSISDSEQCSVLQGDEPGKLWMVQVGLGLAPALTFNLTRSLDRK